MIAIVDYGLCNISSVENAFKRLGIACASSSEPEVLCSATALVIPGVGSFHAAIEHLKDRNLFEVLRTEAPRKPTLGICLGMQLLFDGSDEGGRTEGLGLLPGWVKPIVSECPINIGWKSLEILRETTLYETYQKESTFYFDHEFALAERTEDVDGVVKLGTSDCPVSVSRGSIYGVQFHPEKSQSAGLRLLRAFGNLIK